MMIELSSTIASILEPGNHDVFILFSDTRSTVLFRSIHDDSSEQIISLEGLTLSIIIAEMAAKGRDFHAVTIYSATSEVTCVPEGLFEESHTGLYLDSVFGIQRKRTAAVGHLSALSAHYIFGISTDLLSEINNTFPQARLKHLCESFIIESWADQNHSDKIRFRLHKEGDSLFMLALQGKELKLISHHKIGDATDVVYHSLNTIHALDVNHDQADVIASGELSPDSAGFKLLKSYCPLSKYLAAEFAGIKAPHQFILATDSYCV